VREIPVPVRGQGFAEAVEEDLDDQHPDDQAGDEAQVLHLGEEQQNHQHRHDDQGDAVVDADDTAVPAVVGRDAVDPSFVRHEEPDGELASPCRQNAISRTVRRWTSRFSALVVVAAVFLDDERVGTWRIAPAAGAIISTSVSGKVIAMWMPILVFFYMGFEHPIVRPTKVIPPTRLPTTVGISFQISSPRSRSQEFDLPANANA
jgi:hypothetical protein